MKLPLSSLYLNKRLAQAGHYHILKYHEYIHLYFIVFSHKYLQLLTQEHTSMYPYLWRIVFADKTEQEDINVQRSLRRTK